MSNTGWWGDKTIICLTTDSERRHKTWCRFYSSGEKTCYKGGGKCMGSAHCEYYDKRAGCGSLKHVEAPDYVPTVAINITEPSIVPKALVYQNSNPYGTTLVGHYPSFGEKLVGKTVLIKVAGRVEIGEVIDEGRYQSAREVINYIAIEYDNGEIKKFDKKTVVRVKSFWILDEINEEVLKK